MLVTPLIFIALDYWAGIRKARKRGDPIKSDKMKRTVDKISQYYNSIFAMMVLDAIQIAGFVFLHLYDCSGQRTAHDCHQWRYGCGHDGLGRSLYRQHRG